MALIACPECKKEVSSEAAQCPHCGKEIAPKQSAGGVLAAIIIGLLLGVALLKGCGFL